MYKITVKKISTIVLATFLVGYFIHQVTYGTNESSYKHGYQSGSRTGPTFVKGLNENTEMGTTCTIYKYNPTVTNTTACVDGFFNGWKNWCVNHAVDCVKNLTIGDFPEMIITAHQQYLAGEKAANNTGTRCPIGENAAFCQGWYNNNDDYGGQDCGDEYENYKGPITNLIGCPLDVMKSRQIAALPVLVGTWNFVKQTNGSMDNMSEISGTMFFKGNGYLKISVPNKTALGDYTLEGSWGYVGDKKLTECFADGCENATLTTVGSHNIEFTDNHGDTIHLMRIG